MRTHNTSRQTRSRVESALLHTDSRTPELRPIQLRNSSARPGQHRGSVRRTREPPMLPNGKAELLADIEGLPVLVRLLVQDVPVEMQSDPVYGSADIHPRLSSTLEKIVERMRGSPLRRDDPSKQPLAIVEVISSGEPLVQLPALPNETILRVGPLELDLLDRTAKRGDRRIDLRPREFRLLKYLMQRSDELLTRATLLKEVWNYKFVPETNLVDVHMGRLRRKVDGPNEAPLIRNVRGVGFVLSETPLSQGSPSRLGEQAGNMVIPDLRGR
jgi:DNA-binding winged helix-turn-helix (wHTH) protein